MRRALLTLCAVICSISVVSAKFTPKPFVMTIKYRGEISVGGAFCTQLHVPPQSGFLIEGGGETQLSRPFFETVHGVMISDYIFVGGGIGAQFYAGKCGKDGKKWIKTKEGADRWNVLTIPIFVNLKGFFPINDDLRPFINFGLGGSVVACSNATGEITYRDYYDEEYLNFKHKGGFYLDFGVGVDYKSWTFGLGVQHQRMAQSTEYRYSDPEWNRSYKYKAYCNSFYLKVGWNF